MLINTAVMSNSAGSGGGVYMGYSQVTLNGGQLVGNDATYSGGVYVGQAGAAFTQTGTSSIVLNTASMLGGGVYVDASGTLGLVNSTLSGNSATSDAGGLFNDSGTVALTFTAVASNTSPTYGIVQTGSGGTIALQDTLVAYNGTNCGTALTSHGHNLEYGNSCGLNATGDLANTNPLIGQLTLDSGTWAHPLADNSPAIDKGACVSGISTDQRGSGRPWGSACDIGAYEARPQGLEKVYLPAVLRDAQ
jgi:hypothetical protein